VEECKGDVNGDGAVSAADMASVVQHFGHTKAADRDQWDEHQDWKRDLNGDESITIADLGVISQEFGSTCP
jgi:hypothetical protein